MCTSHSEWLFHPRQPDMQCPQWDLWFRTDPPEQPAHVICSRRRLRPAALLTPAVCGSIRATGAFTASPLMRTIEYSLGQWGTIWFHQHRNGPCEVCLGKGLCSSYDNGKYWGGEQRSLWDTFLNHLWTSSDQNFKLYNCTVRTRTQRTSFLFSPLWIWPSLLFWRDNQNQPNALDLNNLF